VPPRRYLYLPPVPRVRAAGSWIPQIGFRKMVTPKRPPVTAYTTPASAPIGANGIGQTVVANGSATVRIGPSGLGTLWYPNQVTLATTTGAADTSTAIGYLGPVATQSQIVFTSYAGGGDVQGLAIPLMQPGDLLTVVWSGAHNGDQATLVIIGQQQVLTPALCV
jgi:hypothetical protein